MRAVFPKRPRASVWNRLLFSISGIILIVWLVLAVSIVFFLKAQRDYTAIASEQIPALAAVNALAEYSAQLSTMATQIVGQSTDANTSDEFLDIKHALIGSLDAIAETSRTNDAADVVAHVTDELGQIQALQTAISQAEHQMGTQLNALRWLNADVQDEVDPLLSDFSFNIALAMSSIVNSADANFRARQATLIEEEARQRDTVRRLGDGTANAATLVFQAAVAESLPRLQQLRGLTDDALVHMSLLQQQLPHKPELATLRQSVDALVPVATSKTGVFSLRRGWLDGQAQILTSLSALQADLRTLQSVLSAAGAEQRARILADTERARRASAVAIRWLVGLTMLAAFVGVGVLFGYVRSGIVRPLRQMTKNLSDIAQGQNLKLPPNQEDDEIVQLSVAISEFERSIETRDAALASLESEVQERRRAVETLKQTQMELIQAGKMAALGQMSAGIAHELNQPLAAMQHRLHLLEDFVAEGDSEMVTRQMSRLDGLIDRMTRTIAYLRNFARRSEFSEDHLPLDEMVADSLALLKARVTQEDVQVHIQSTLADMSVLGDKILIEQVLVNILSNALDAIQQTEHPGRIDVSARREGDTVQLSVRDNGAGFDLIPASDALDPFVTSKEVGKGLGLGLSISYNIMKDLNGDLRLTPNVDAPGATATLVLRRED
ncbi:ATP-binding protein [Shimia sagamensis]|uniref:histidine kinase n=1 Tax=Shimia sagamensis TaxID=1566352 RepID=A0ABY1PJZ7_9RHOB|nr:ATP-binding protein [Shimia sagamensis]SMP35750.1 two-component system, NtrC family, C4-dicarboxylate transport sensor histidine kinase DctB [Shimia sagamensis]